MRCLRFSLLAVLLFSILAACSIPTTDGTYTVGKWTVTPLAQTSSNSKVIAAISTGSPSSSYSRATRKLSINGSDCYLNIYGEASAIENRVADPWFGLLDIDDPANGISYHDVFDENSPEAKAYVASLKNKTPPDPSSLKKANLEVAFEGLPPSKSLEASDSAARLTGLAGFNYVGGFSAGSGGGLLLHWGWLFFGVSTGTGIHDSTPSGVVNTSIIHQSVTGGSWYAGASYSPITLASGEIILSDYQFGFWNYEATWNVVTAAYVLFGTTISF